MRADALRGMVVTSDWHLDASTAGFDRFEDVSAAVDEVVAYAIASKASLFVFLGDLCDPDANRSPRCVGKAIEVAHRLRASGIRSRWLVGNHDVVEDGSGTSTLTPLAAAGASGGGPAGEGWRVIDRPTTEFIGGVEFIWLPYVPRCASYDPAMFVTAYYELAQPEGSGAPLVVAGHLSIAGKHPGSETDEMGRGREMVLPVARVRELWPEAFLMNGHYHDAQANPDGVVIPGSLARLTFGEETNHPGFLVAEPSRKTRSKKRPAWSVAAHSIASRRLVTVDPVGGLAAANLKARGAESFFDGALVRLRPSAGTLPGQTEELAEAVRSGGAMAVKVLPAPLAPAVVVPEPGTPPAARLRARDVAEAMVADAVGVDREALAALVGEVLDAEGM